ncbi:hypothetical protein QNO07_12015 [Streptomyces sp. 549]|uniref:hypothetical protein n=1 Tax=Streptomyces sp. 549 TaxID=3049076 RepID=UPI0024C20FBE|nr:hypothetical protein [Streptomyces sp. 549]MDK1474132.1 hypothetical protein [Streptomyces sp. 549]
MRRRTTAVALAAVAALAAGGCGSNNQSVRSDGSPSASEKQTRFDKRAAKIEAEWPEVSAVSGRPDDMLPLEDASPPGSDDTTFEVAVGHGACDEDFGVHVKESEGYVVVAGWAKPKDVDFCTDQLLIDDVEVELEQPLGDRTVVDAATGKDLLEK